jgi:SAM-dependent methyltransferase
MAATTSFCFYNSFHHCLDFDVALALLKQRLNPVAIVIFGNVSRDFPEPWGLRLDGPSLFDIRTKGWLELGFREDFFLDLLWAPRLPGDEAEFPRGSISSSRTVVHPGRWAC